MKIVFHQDHKKIYSDDPPSAEGRLDTSISEHNVLYPFVSPAPASVDDIELVHTKEHIRNIMSGPGTSVDLWKAFSE